jgi:hypothetical protein
LFGPLACALQADPGAPDAIGKNAKSTAACHGAISSIPERSRNPPVIAARPKRGPNALPGDASVLAWIDLTTN